jgi:hypothetical protein
MQQLFKRFISVVFVLFISSPVLYAQQVIEAGLIDLQPEGIASYFVDLATSPNQKQLTGIVSGGRVICFDFSAAGKLTQVWRNLELTNGRQAQIVDYSISGKFITIRGGKSNLIKNKGNKRQLPDDGWVIDASTGKELLHVNECFNIQMVNDEIAFVSSPNGLAWYSIADGKLKQEFAMKENECAAISPDGKNIVVSVDADTETFKNIASATKRKKEIKNARKAKKMLFIYKIENLQKPYLISSDEVDIVVQMKFDAEGKYLYYTAFLGGQENSTSPALKVLERMELATGEIDLSYGVKSGDMNAYFRANADHIINTTVEGMSGQIHQIQVRSLNDIASVMADYEVKGKFLKFSSYYNPVALVGGTTKAFIGMDKTIYEWDFVKVPHFRRKGIQGGDEEMAEKLSELLSASIEAGDIGKKVVKNNLIGTYVMDITVGEKGKVLTVFCESDELTNIKQQNLLKDIIKEQKFEVEIPKGRRVKFRYAFDFQQ